MHRPTPKGIIIGKYHHKGPHMKYANGVKATTLTTGTGDVTLAEVSGYVPFPLAFSVGDTIPYAIHNGQNWEWGVGTVQAGGVLERTTVASTLVAGVFTDVAPARITLTGVSEVVCAVTAEDYRALNDSLLAHTTDVANPHGVTAAQANADEAGTAAGLVAAHEIAPDPHSVYPLEADLGTAAFLDVGTAVGDVVQVQTGGKLPALDASDLLNLPASGVTDHGALTGLADDDHTQYHTDARGDARYAPLAKGVTGGDTHNHDGGDGAQIAYASLSGLPTLGSAAAAATGDFEPSGAVSTHNAVATAHGISAWGATLVDDADANTARSTLGLGTAATTASTAYATSTQGANADAHNAASAPHAGHSTPATLASAVSAHASGTDVHAIASVTGLVSALAAKAPTASPTFTGTVGGITAAMVGAPAGSGTSTGANTGDSATPAETTNSIGALINSATSKTTPVDADHIGLMDSAAANIWKKLSWANIKTALSNTFVTLAGATQNIAGNLGLGISPTAVLHLKAGTASASTAPLKFTTGTKLTAPEAGAVEYTGTALSLTNSANIRRNLATEEYVQGRGGATLFTNGFGLLGDNTNMSAYTFDTVDVFGGGGSFRISGNPTVFSDEFIPVALDGTRYQISLSAKAGDIGGGNFDAANKQFFGVALYDIDLNSVLPTHTSKYAGSTDTVLTTALNPGDTVVNVANATGWYTSSSATYRHFVWYGYANTKGYVYPDYTYTRNTSKNYSSNATNGTWLQGGISGNVITLQTPWAGPALPIGAPVRNRGDGGNNKYVLLNGLAVPNAWTQYSGYIGGLPSDGSDTLNQFRFGTAYIKFLHLVNYTTSASNNVRLNNISITPLSSANLESQIGIGSNYKTQLQTALPSNGLAVEGNAGFGTLSPSARVHVIGDFRQGFDTANYQSATVSSGGIPTWTSTGGAFIFQGDIRLNKTVTTGGTTGAQTINKSIGSVNFAAGASSLVVTNSLVTTSSVITAIVGTNDATMKSVAAVAAAGSFTLHANAAATAETRVNFNVFN